ncbi:MAG: AAA family ATPase [Pseudomonadota bacterium]
MRRLVVFGKGGIGKSTICTNLATLLARRGEHVLQIGCDPKHDSHLRHSIPGRITTVMEAFLASSGTLRPADLRDLVVTGGTGVDVLETGGPEPGRGCAGRAVDIVLDVIKEPPALTDDYDWVLFDVLGDVVCGGFSAPIREETPSDIVLVASEEYMALYAANNIARGIRNLSSGGGARLIGVVGNKIHHPHAADLIERFAAALGTRVLGLIPFSAEVVRVEFDGETIVLAAPDAEVTEVYRSILDQVLTVADADRVIPTPLDEGAIREIYLEHLSQVGAG